MSFEQWINCRRGFDISIPRFVVDETASGFDHADISTATPIRHLLQALGIGYAPRGHDEGYVAIPIRLPTGELTGYIRIIEGKLPKEFHLSNVVRFPKKGCLGSTPRSDAGFSLF
jgi:hypothetical protein